LTVGSFCYCPVEEVDEVAGSEVDERYPSWEPRNESSSWQRCREEEVQRNEYYGEYYDIDYVCDESFAPCCECDLSWGLNLLSACWAVGGVFRDIVSAVFAVRHLFSSLRSLLVCPVFIFLALWMLREDVFSCHVCVFILVLF